MIYNINCTNLDNHARYTGLNLKYDKKTGIKN